MTSTQRLHDVISAACPVVGVSVGTPGDSDTVRIDFAPDATAEQEATAQALLASFGWSDEAQEAWDARQVKDAAKAKLIATDDPHAVAMRAVGKLTAAIVSNVRDKINELVAWANAQGATIEPLAPNQGLAVLIAETHAVIDAETSPTE